MFSQNRLHRKIPQKRRCNRARITKKALFLPGNLPLAAPGRREQNVQYLRHEKTKPSAKKEKKKKGGAASFYTEDRKSPALAVGTRLKPARDGRWVASAVLLCFQLPTGGREACNSHGESASRFRNVGLKGSKMTHEPSRASASIKCSCQRILLGEGLIPRRPLRPGRAPP